MAPHHSGEIPTLAGLRSPVELLRDKKGVYGIGVRKSTTREAEQAKLILRSDRFAETFASNAALQMIPSGGGRGVFKNTIEERLRQQIHHELLRRRGLQSPCDEREFWSSDRHQKALHRQLYHGLRVSSEAIMNRLIKMALDEAAEPNALEVARRFRLRHRYSIYRAASLDTRALQLAITFPVLSLAVFGRESHPLAGEAALLVTAGAPLKTIAALMGTFLWLSER